MHALKNVRQFGSHIVLGLAVLGMGGAVHAHDAKPGETAVSKQERHAKWGEMRAKRQAALHDALKLNPGQESAWQAYQSSSKRPALGAEQRSRLKAERAARRAEWASLSAPARLEKRLAMSKQRLAAMESRLSALNTFYSTLSPEQKKLFDENSKRVGHRMKHRGMHHGHA